MLKPASQRSAHPWAHILYILILLLYADSVVWGQSGSLLPSIGLTSVPQDTDSICAIPIVAGHSRGYKDVGPAVGSFPPDFTLYDSEGAKFTLSEALAERKPILLVNGSYTCPVFREKIPLINEIVRDYGDSLTVAIIYTLEAHPLIDTSVYYGYVNTTKQNLDDSVLYRQPLTYGERKEIVKEMLAEMAIDAPVYIDGPCNEWWEHFGPAPNNAYLIDTSGLVFAKHGWFNRYPDIIHDDIARLFGRNVQSEDSIRGLFQFTLTSPTVITGPVNEILYGTAELRNNSNRRAEIEIVRRNDYLPAGWATALCTDICHDTWVDTTRVVLEPGATQVFTLYFYPGSTVDSARVTVMFRNPYFPQNRFMQIYTGITTPITTSVAENRDQGIDAFTLSPNPAIDAPSARFTLQRPEQVRLELFDALGREIASPYIDLQLEAGRHELPLPSLAAGIYFVRLRVGSDETCRTLHILE